MKNLTTYISPTTQGHVWHFCTLHTWYIEGGLWIDPPSSCAGSDCPSPGYIIRPCIGPSNPNWGGVNTATCYAPDQLMEIIFEMPTAPNDAGIASIDSPLNFCAGTLPIVVTLKNYGTPPLSSVTINWKLNNVLQTPLSWTGYLDTLNQSTRVASVTLNSAYNFVSGVPYTIEVWTTNPNGVIDTVKMNDTVKVTRKAAMSGTLTIGGAGANYTNFTAAVNDLVANGVCGPVTFKVRPGNYPEQISLGAINGASAINTITFESESGNNNDVFMSYTGTSTTNNYVVRLDGCDYVTFKNMTMTATGGSYGNVVVVQGGATYCTLDRLVLNGVPTTSTSTYLAVVYSPSGSLDHHTTITGCMINNGAYGLYWYGSSSASYEIEDVIEKNIVQNFYYMGMALYYHDKIRVEGNTVTTMSTYTNYLIYCYYGANQIQIIRNNCSALGGAGTKYGLYINYCTASAGNEGLIANNFVTIANGASTAYAMYIYYSNYQEVYFNTVYTNSTYSLSRCLYSYYGSNLKMSNNILYNDGLGYAWYNYHSNPNTNVISSDENLLYTNGANIAYWNGAARATLGDLQAVSGKENNSITKGVVFVNKAQGDLHLTGTSEDDVDLIGAFEPEVYDDIDDDGRFLPYRGADEACYITRGTVFFEFVDGNGQKTPYANIPGTTAVRVYVAFPEFEADIDVTLNFYTVPGNALAYTTTVSAHKNEYQTLDVILPLSLGTLTTGQYRVQAVFHTKNSCGGYRNYSPSDQAMMLLPTGQTPCLVWPGDANNDGIVNFGDRKALNNYIHDANLSPSWLSGPARYRPDAATNPFTYYTWEAQAAVPWSTPEGCYMDCDGNGTVNNFDFIVLKVNWMRTHGIFTPKQDQTTVPGTFDMSQNFPNPFNPSTQIQYSVPEPSEVKITVFDMNGKEIATLVNGIMQPGTHTAAFDATGLGSGMYIATATMRGTASGTEFTRTIRMTLNK